MFKYFLLTDSERWDAACWKTNM